MQYIVGATWPTPMTHECIEEMGREKVRMYKVEKSEFPLIT